MTHGHTPATGVTPSHRHTHRDDVTHVTGGFIWDGRHSLDGSVAPVVLSREHSRPVAAGDVCTEAGRGWAKYRVGGSLTGCGAACPSRYARPGGLPGARSVNAR
jgi:hypothetical protein